jgi:hypothetical protein
MMKCRRWTEEQSAKLATGLLARLPNLRRLCGYLSNAHFQVVLGKALCQLEEPPLAIEELVWNGPEEDAEYYFWCDAWTPIVMQQDEDVSPLAVAMGLGKLPALKSLNSFALKFTRASLTAVTDAVSDGHLLNLASLVINFTDDMEGVMEEFVEAYMARHGRTEEKQQVDLRVLDIRGAIEDDVHAPLRKLIHGGPCEDLTQLHLGKGSSNQPTLLSVGLSYLLHKRLNLRELSLPRMEDGNLDLMDDLVQALTVHQVAPNLESLGFSGMTPSAGQKLMHIYQWGGLQHLRKLDVGILLNNSPLTDFFQAIAQCAHKGGALEELKGETMSNSQDSLAGALCKGLKSGAFPRLQSLLFTHFFNDEDSTQLLVNALTQAPRPPFVATLRCICIEHIEPAQEAALRGLLGGEELKIVNFRMLRRMRWQE